jgi:hypothetical protein
MTVAGIKIFFSPRLSHFLIWSCLPATFNPASAALKKSDEKPSCAVPYIDARTFFGRFMDA